MKKLFLLSSIIASPLLGYNINDLITLASGEKNGDLLVQLAVNLSAEDLTKNSFKNKVKSAGLNEATFSEKLAAKKKELGLGGGGMTEAQARQLLAEAKVNVPEIKDIAGAKKALTDFFGENQAGGKLLKELGVNPAPVQNALK
jgi:hypothetical protein